MRISDICDAFGQDRETKDHIRERILLMARYSVVFRDGEFVSTNKILDKRTMHDETDEIRVSRSLKPIKVEALSQSYVSGKEIGITEETLEPIIKNAKTVLHEV
jgi:hypothetical protein